MAGVAAVAKEIIWRSSNSHSSSAHGRIVSQAKPRRNTHHVSPAVQSTGAAAAAGVMVVVPQQSSARIEKSNRRTQFGEPLPTIDCEDDDELCDLLYSDVQIAGIDDLPQVVSGSKAFRKLKKVNMASPKVKAGVQKRDSTPESKQLSISNVPKSAKINNRSEGRKIRSSMAQKHRVPNSEQPLIPRRNWEEQAYQIIRQQKLRDAAKATTVGLLPKPMVENHAHMPSTGGTEKANLDQMKAGTKRDGSMGDVDFVRMSQRLNLEEKSQPLVEYLHGLGLRTGDFIRIVDRHKACLRANVTVVKERVEFLLAVGVQFHHLPKLITRHPQILEYRVEEAMKPRVFYLKSLGLDDSKIGKIITVSPSLLECSLNRSIKPRITYLTDVVGINSEDIGKIVMRSPQILTQSIEDSLQPRVDFFLNEIKLPRDALAKMVTRHPQLLHYSLEDGIRPRVKYLHSIGMSNDDLPKVLARLTQVLSLSIEKCLQPKYNYLVKELKGDVRTVTTFPAYFSLSLDHRIIPRHMYLQSLKGTLDKPFPMRLLAISDLAFCKWAKSTLEDYEKFRHNLLLTNFPKKFEKKTNIHM